MSKAKMSSHDLLAKLNDSIAKLRSGKKVNIPQLESAIDRCEQAIKASLRVLSQIRAEVRKMKKQATKPKRKPV